MMLPIETDYLGCKTPLKHIVPNNRYMALCPGFVAVAAQLTTSIWAAVMGGETGSNLTLSVQFFSHKCYKKLDYYSHNPYDNSNKLLSD